MNRVRALLARLLGNEWREIGTAPFGCEIEVAIIDGDFSVPGGSYLRHDDGWLDAETLRPVELAATHWRYLQLAMPPMSRCC
jgi:hypothetical protein